MTRESKGQKNQEHIKKVVFSRLKQKNNRKNNQSYPSGGAKRNHDNTGKGGRKYDQHDNIDEDTGRTGISLERIIKRGPRMYNIEKHEKQIILEENQKKRYEQLKKKIEKRGTHPSAKPTRDLYTTENTDTTDDPLLRLRDEDIAIQKAQLQAQQQRENKKKLHEDSINLCVAFIRPILQRAKKSISLARKGETPLHEYDPLVHTPLDLFVLYPHFSPTPEVTAAFQYLLKREQVFDSTAYKLVKITPSSKAHMVRLEKKVEALQSIVEKENRYQSIKQKQSERVKVNRMLRERTSRGQPVMKNQINHLLSKLQGGP